MREAPDTQGILQHLPAKCKQRPKKILLSMRWALALCHMANTALVIALR